MFDKLVDLLVQFWDSFIPVVIVEPFEECVCVHFGSRIDVYTSDNGLFRTGIHFKVPFLAQAHTDNIVPGVATFEPQVAMTKDGRPLVAKVIMLWSIKDITKAQLEVEDIDHALSNAGESVVFNVLNRHTIEELYTDRDKIEREMLIAIRRRAGKWGIKVHSIEFTHAAEAYILRLVD
jgi:regulator of protease activity HflC (stomatin/prohibitin superfamily)